MGEGGVWSLELGVGEANLYIRGPREHHRLIYFCLMFILVYFIRFKIKKILTISDHFKIDSIYVILFDIYFSFHYMSSSFYFSIYLLLRVSFLLPIYALYNTSSVHNVNLLYIHI